ncbi:MAG: PDZ domain-containing protein [Pseudomonadota bacterium]
MPVDYSVFYRVVPVHPEAHLYNITCEINHPAANGQEISLPAWIPGSYMIRDFAKNVVSLSARDAQGHAVATRKLDKHTWRCAPCTGALTVQYSVYAWDLSVRGAHLDTTHAYFNGAGMFIRIHGQEGAAHGVALTVPEGEKYLPWRVSTSMTRDAVDAHGVGGYRAMDYEDLIDHPVEMGTFQTAEFEACGVPHEIAVTGRQQADLARVARDIARVCEWQIRFFGEPAPMRRYVFLVTAIGEGYGGLEHRASTSLLCSREDLPRAGDKEVSERYRNFLGLCSHEYFHAWLVKRIKPAVFMSYDLTREVHTPLLWVFEGFTTYYDDLVLARCGLIDERAYLEILAQTITRVWQSAGRHQQSVAESSFDAWTKFYKADENAPNAIVSYYVKGAIVALALDFTLRLATDNAQSLDTLMRALWNEFGIPGKGVQDDDIRWLAERLCGQDLGDFFARYVEGCEDPPLAQLLAQFGIECIAQASSAKPGAIRREDPNNARPAVGLGAKLGGGDEARVLQVYAGGAAQQAGLAAGDTIVALDGLRVARAEFDRRLGQFPIGTHVKIHAFRRDELMEFSVPVQALPEDVCQLGMLENIDAAQRQRRALWIRGKHAS